VSLNAVDAGDTTRLQISCTTDQLDYAVGRANQMLTSPMLPSDEFEKFKRQSIAGLVQGLTNPSSVAERELVQNLYPNSTLGRVTTPQTLQAITLDDVKQWYQTYYQLDGAFVVVSGDVTPQRARELTEKLVAGFNRHKKPAPADYSVAPAPPSRRIVLIDNPEGRQAVVRMAARAYDIRSDDKFPGSLAGNILSAGIESRLNRYVRAEKGLTYGCAAYFRPSRHAGQFSGSVDTNPETTGAAIEAMLKVFNDLRADAVPNQELQEAQSRVSGGMVMEMQTVSQQAGRRIDQILNDYPIDYWDKYSEQINKVTAEQVKDVMSQYVKPDQMLFVVVAPAAAVRSQLEKLGTVEVMPMPLRRNAPATAPAAGTARQAMGDFIAWMDQLRTTLEGVKDKPSAEAAAKALDAAAETAKKLAAQSAALMAQGIDPAEAQAVQQELGAKLQQAVEKLQAERQRIDRDATLKEIVGSKINALMDLFSASSAPPAARSQ
jgi:zinc protease